MGASPATSDCRKPLRVTCSEERPSCPHPRWRWLAQLCKVAPNCLSPAFPFPSRGRPSQELTAHTHTPATAR